MVQGPHFSTDGDRHPRRSFTKNGTELDVVFIGYGALNVVRDREIGKVYSDISRGRNVDRNVDTFTRRVKEAVRNESWTQLRLEMV